MRPPTPPRATPRRAAPGKINHVLVIELENEGFDATFGPGSLATYLNGTLRKKGELLQNYYGVGHDSLDNYIAQVSGQAPTTETQADCSANGFAFANVTPGTADANQTLNPGQVDGQGCVYPTAVKTIASQLDAKYPPNPKTHVAAWRAYEQDMGNTPARDGGTPDPSGGTDCAHPAIGATDTAEVATAADQYTTRHNPFVWFHSVIDSAAECNANDVPLGTLAANGSPSPSGTSPATSTARARRRASASSRQTCVATATTAPAPARTARAATSAGSPEPISSCRPGCRSS